MKNGMDIYCSDGMHCRPQTMQPLPDVDVRICQGGLPMQAHSYTKREAGTDSNTVHSDTVGYIPFTCVPLMFVFQEEAV